MNADALGISILCLAITVGQVFIGGDTTVVPSVLAGREHRLVRFGTAVDRKIVETSPAAPLKASNINAGLSFKRTSVFD